VERGKIHDRNAHGRIGPRPAARDRRRDAAQNGALDQQPLQLSA
jgi:hypothetical protein